MKKILGSVMLCAFLFGCADTDVTPGSGDIPAQKSSKITETSASGNVTTFQRTYAYQNGLRISTHRNGRLESRREYSNDTLVVNEDYNYAEPGENISRRDVYDFSQAGIMTRVYYQRINSNDPVLDGTLRKTGHYEYTVGNDNVSVDVKLFDSNGELQGTQVWTISNQNVISKVGYDESGNFLWKVEKDFNTDAFNPNWNLTGYLAINFEDRNIPTQVRRYDTESGIDTPKTTEDHTTILTAQGYPTEWSYVRSDGYQWKINWSY